METHRRRPVPSVRARWQRMSDDKKKLFEQVMRASVHRVVQRMRTLGFWPADQGLPPDPPDEAQERHALEAERVRLLALAHGEVDIDQALRAEHQRRILAAREKRKQRQLEREQARQKRRDKWATVRALGIVHAGAEVSAGLNATQSDEAALLSRGIPILHTPADVARFLAIELGQLRFLTFHRRGAAVVHYRRYEIPKKTGGVRRISAPKPRLASAQQKVFHDILERLTVEPEAHGFVKARSIVTNALPHVGKRVVANLDLKDFFPTITFRRVKGLFAKLGYSESVATVLSLLLTEPPRRGLRRR
jgi:RNA-directed DNA polymerase